MGMETKSFKAWAEAFAILAKYSDKSFAVSAEHDILWCDLTWPILSGEDAKRLEELGFHKDTEFDSDGQVACFT